MSITPNRPLCVDLDGTLTRSDLLVESLFGLLRIKPWAVFLLPLWSLRGKAYLKHRIARDVDVDVAMLPYNDALLAHLRDLHASGRVLVLATATHAKYANGVAAHLRIFDDTLATSDGHNLSGEAKRSALVKRFGKRGFDYAGNARRDIAIWSDAAEAIVVNPERGVRARVAKLGIPTRYFEDRSAATLSLAKALRLHQWLKNLLVFVPLVAAHQVGDAQLRMQAGFAFVAFCLAASSVYVLNDLLDLESDRHHPRKRCRVFASGNLPVAYGLALAPLLLVFGAAISLALLPIPFLLALFGYYGLSISYSLWARTKAILDVMFLASLYTLRILAGAAAVLVTPSFWLLAFSMFLFLSLALVKRYSELIVMRNADTSKTTGRGYTVDDLSVLQSLGTTSGYLSVLVLALYINSPDVYALYIRPEVLWALCPLLLFWISRMWMITHRGMMHDDPVVFAARDPTSLLVAAFAGLTLVIASA